MARRSHDIPAWRVFSAALGAFALGIQLLLSGWIIVQVAAAADATDLAVICTHDRAAPDQGSGAPTAPDQHGQCPVCACLQSAQLLGPPPPAASHVVPEPRSERLPTRAEAIATEPSFRSPYSSRAPPFFA